MAIVVAASGTVTPTTLGTEQALAAADTTSGTYVLVVDTVNVVNGEIVDLRIAGIVLAAGTERTIYRVSYQHLQGEPIKYSPPVPSDVSIRTYITQTGGTLRAYPWKLLRL